MAILFRNSRSPLMRAGMTMGTACRTAGFSILLLAAQEAAELPEILVKGASLAKPKPNYIKRKAPVPPASASDEKPAGAKAKSFLSGGESGASQGAPKAPANASTPADAVGDADDGQSQAADTPGESIDRAGSAVTVVTGQELWAMQIRPAATLRLPEIGSRPHGCAGIYEAARGVERYGGVENAFDEDYQGVFGFETAGAAAYVGIKLTGVIDESRAWSEGR
jgi:hypothetical protein